METTGRISHRASGGPDLNYLYATERDDDDDDDAQKKIQKRGRRADGRSLRGQTLYLGGEEAENGKIYCIPGHAERVLCIDTETDEAYPIGPIFDASNTILRGKYKWLRGIVHRRIVYGLPCHADVVLRIDTAVDAVSVLDIPYERYFDASEAHRERHRAWKYHGGAVGSDGCIYAVPQSAGRVLRIDPTTDECSFVGPVFEGRCKWYGGVVGNTDGAIYAIPHNAGGVLRIDASGVEFGEAGTTMESRVRVTTHGEFPVGGHKWHGASASDDGTIVSVPANADSGECTRGIGGETWHVHGANDSWFCRTQCSVLFLPRDRRIHETLRIPPIRSLPCTFFTDNPRETLPPEGIEPTGNTSEYLGAMAGTDGKVYCFPSGSERVLQVDTVRKVARSVGPNLRDRGMESMHQNKWQNGITAHQEGCVYAIPLAGETVLRIRTGRPGGNGSDPVQDAADDVEVTTWKLPWPSKTLEKWEGGVLAKNGVIYCMPNNHKAVLQIVPACVPSRDDLAKKRQEKEMLRQKEREAREMQQDMERRQKQAEKEARRQERKSRMNAATANGNTETSTDEPRTNHTTNDGVHYKYTTGIATLRSSAHRVKYSLEHRKHDPNPVIDGKATNTTFLPDDLCREDVFSYCTETYDFHSAVARMLEASEKELVGTFQSLNGCGDSNALNLDSFTVPSKSLTRKCQRGNLELAQKYLSEVVGSDSSFLSLFDNFLTNVILPHLKQRLIDAGVATPENTVTFYYQRPPTLRIQPGPARALVRAHDDAEYGHQNGELNFWLPLTDRRKTGVDLWVESVAKAGDFHPLMAEYGEVASFHGSSCRHYVNANRSAWTRVSLDFRVGVQGYFDPHWQMIGTTDDHSRRKVTL
ncbi:hypothetical protein ACHAWX_004635 [Stephanocyclus meneghinianus]